MGRRLPFPRARLAAAAAHATEVAKHTDVIPVLLARGHDEAHARFAASMCVALPGAPLEQRVRFACTFLEPAT